MNRNRTLVLLPPKEIHHSNDSLSTSLPVSRRKDNPIVHSAMSLNSLLKKEGIEKLALREKDMLNCQKQKDFWPQPWLIADGYLCQLACGILIRRLEILHEGRGIRYIH